MTVFKAFLQVLNKCKGMVIIYTVLLLLFGGVNSSTNAENSEFTADKPELVIVNRDCESGITKNLVDYLTANSERIEFDTEAELDDAIFYRQVDFVLYIPAGYREAVLAGKQPELQYKSSGSAEASFAQMMLERYLQTQQMYVQEYPAEETKICTNINSLLEVRTEVVVTTKLDTTALSKAASYFNFASYSLLAGAIFVICMVLTSFQEVSIRKRITVSSMNYKKHNTILLASNLLFALVMWLFYGIIGIVVVGEAMWSVQGLLYLANSFVFTLCALTMAFLISSICSNKDAINGIVNVLALGSAFLCGAFIPVQWLPEGVLAVGHIFPAYWYIQNNEYIKTLEHVSFDALKPMFWNIAAIIVYGLCYILLANRIAAKKRVVA